MILRLEKHAVACNTCTRVLLFDGGGVEDHHRTSVCIVRRQPELVANVRRIPRANRKELSLLPPPPLYVSVQAGNHSSPGSSDRKVKESSGRVGSLHIICRHATVYIRIHEGPRRRKVQRGCPRGAS